LFLLGALSEEDSLQLREHLSRGCEACRARLKEAARTVYLLSLFAKPVAPGPKAKAELLRFVKNK
jgi:predicted anti-sigma-YlaC factor YlaD